MGNELWKIILRNKKVTFYNNPKAIKMKITYYQYNAFIIEWDEKKLVIDPGALFAYWFSFAPLIPNKTCT